MSAIPRPLTGRLTLAGRWRSTERWLALAVFVAVWELLPRTGVVSDAYLSPPSDIVAAIADLARSGVLWKHLSSSLQRSLAGLLLAIAGGVSLGLLMGRFVRLESIVDPLLQGFRQTSAFALFPVFILFLGIGELSKVAIIFWASFWPVLLSTISGVKQVDRLTALVAAEMIGAHAGLGFLTLNSQEVFQIPSMYAGIVLLALLGLMLNYVLAAIERRCTRWRRGLGPQS